ncbi:MAG: NUDIX hydrolase [Candidatus Saccharimonadales bacterium]
MHQIQRFILKILTTNATARFAQLRPPRTDSNLFSYHLKVLLKEGLIEKNEKQYRLSPRGLGYADRISMAKFEPRQQPKIMTMTVLRRSDGRIFLMRREKQPFIGMLTLPSGKVHLDDAGVREAAQRELLEKLGLTGADISHKGDGYLRTYQGNELISSIFCHIFVGGVSKMDAERLRGKWLAAEEVEIYPEVAPGIAEAAHAALESKSGFFFEITKWL